MASVVKYFFSGALKKESVFIGEEAISRKKEGLWTTFTIHSTSEKVIATISRVTRKKGFLGLKQESYVVVVTAQHLLFAKMNKALLAKQAEELKQLRKQNKTEGKGFFVSLGDSIAAGLLWYNRYLDMAPEEILAESKENFFLLRSDILPIKAHQFLGMNHADPDTPLPSFTIKTREKKYKFLLTRGYDPAQLKMLQEWSRSF